jgi:hypothetical protein
MVLPSRRLKPTLECVGENYPYTQMIISTLFKWNPKRISQAFSWDIIYRDNHNHVHPRNYKGDIMFS